MIENMQMIGRREMAREIDINEMLWRHVQKFC